ncbi:MAG TPA: alpha/beta hydrolase [Hyphomonadaceae bacterium]|jgi:pimeloyl-ACP methyl ester carboxylesterase|nr:alpha/beta hydrolase [Hyphomonadaceae bacterium]
METLVAVGKVVAIAVGVIAAFMVLGAVLEWLARAMSRNKPPGRMVDIGGRKLHLLVKGDAPGPTVILEMGAMEPSIYWWHIQNAVAGFARVATYDRAGFGWSPRTTPQSMEDRAADLAKLLTAANVPGPYVLVGHSFGGPLIRLFARDNVEKAAGLVFIDTPDETAMFRESYLSYVRKSMRPMLGLMKVLSRIGVLRLFGFLNHAKGLSTEARRALDATRRPDLFDRAREEFDSILNAPQALRVAHGQSGHLGSRPVSVVTHGIKFPAPWDVLEQGWDEGQQNLVKLSDNSEFVVAEKSNHMIQADEPDLVIAAIRRVWEAARDGKRLSQP